MSESFAERASDMGLEANPIKGLYSYADRYGEVVYRELFTRLFNNSDSTLFHPTDGQQAPMIAIFTKAPEWTDYQYAGYVSNLYKFIGNDVLNQRIRDAILSVGMPIMTENTIMTYDNTRMRNEIIIQNGQQVANAGDVLPVMIVNNSYNGTRAASVAFGISMAYARNRVTFGFSLGELRQVHIASSSTSVTSAVNSYMEAFTTGIADMITQSFSSTLNETEMLAVLDVIEGFGKKRREAVSTLLDEIQRESGNQLPTAWQMFLAIVRYSSFEPNLNTKRLMENAAESVLVIPQRMFEVLERLQSS
jgi:hypothetical protein